MNWNSIIETPLTESEREALHKLADEVDFGNAVLILSALWNLEQVERADEETATHYVAMQRRAIEAEARADAAEKELAVANRALDGHNHGQVYLLQITQRLAEDQQARIATLTKALEEALERMEWAIEHPQTATLPYAVEQARIALEKALEKNSQ